MIDGLFGQAGWFGRIFHADDYALHDTSSDIEYCKYVSKDKRKITVQTFGCYVPHETAPEFKQFYTILENALSTILSRKGRVFIANHTQAWSLEDIPSIAALYNSLKKSHPHADLLQLYTQGGNGKVRYYLHNLYDQSSQFRKDEVFEAPAGEFIICRSLLKLCAVKEFSPRLEPSPLITNTLFSKNSETPSFQKPKPRQPRQLHGHPEFNSKLRQK